MMDYHIHPDYSIDAEGSLEEFCTAALNKGLKEICITTHIDSDRVRDDSFVIVKGERVSVHNPMWFEAYENHVKSIGDEYSNQGLTVLLGAEVDLYPGVSEDLPDAFHKIDFDLVIGSVHLIDHKAISVKEEAFSIFKKYGLEGVGNIYYDLIKDSLKTGLFDILGHLDIYRRYGEEFFGAGIHSLWESHIDELCKIMKSQGVGYEVNTSSLWRGLSETMPERNFVKSLHDKRIQIVTVGSDAHQPNEVGKGIPQALQLLRESGYSKLSRFSKRRTKSIPLDSFK
ncbi:MAG: histidinol-phosphatase HisJ family protein [Candidatus Thorarchaeota archaeon]|jgi:histidinol-phosphatase (PHP family)